MAREGILCCHESICEPNSSVVFDENGFNRVNWTNVVPVLAFIFNWWQFLATVIAFNNPAPH